MAAENDKSNAGNPHDPDQFDNELREILKFLLQSPRPRVISEIARAIKSTQQKTEYYLIGLQSYGLVDVTTSWQIGGPLGFDPAGYVLTEGGRIFVQSIGG